MTRILSRPLTGYDDFMRVRQFLIDTYALYGHYQNWEIRRWEGHWNGHELSDAQLWETEAGDLVGAVHPEGANGDAWLEIHPDYRHLEAEMLEYAETRLAVIGEDGLRHLDLYIYDDDDYRRNLAAQRGYIESENWDVLRRATLDHLLASAPDHDVPPDYTIRTLRPGSDGDTAGWATVSGIVFGHTIDPIRFARFQSSPSFRHDLHFIAEAPDGSFAAFAGLTVEPITRTAIFEPVGTHPAHRRKHLASAAMVAGMKKLDQMGGIDMVYVGTGDMVPANGLYDSLGFNDNRRLHRWHLAAPLVNVDDTGVAGRADVVR